MANEVSIKISTDAKKASQDFDSVRNSIKLLDQEARRLGTGFTAGASQAETALGRLQQRMRTLRTEIAQTQAASRNLGGGGRGAQFLSGVGGSLPGGGALSGGAAGVGAAVGAFAVGAAYTGYNEARAQASAESYLANAVKQTGQSYAYQAGEVAKLRRELGLTTAQATELQAASLRFTSTIGKPGDAGKLARALANSLAASGRSTSEIPDRLRQLQTGQDELFDVLGPVKIGKTTAGSPEAIYKAYAREILNVNRELSDLEKTQARYYAVLQAGEAAQGAAADRMSTSAGQIDKLTNAFKDLTGNIMTAVAATEEFKIITGGLNAVAEGGAAGLVPKIVAGAFSASTYGLAPIVNGIQSSYGMAASGWDSITDPAGRGASLGFGYLGSQFANQARAVGGFFGFGGGGPASSLSGPYSGALDTPRYLDRDPFAWRSTAEQNAANAPGILAKRLAAQEALKRLGSGLVPGISSAYSGVVSAGDLLANFDRSETPEQRAARIFSVSGAAEREAAQAYRLAGYSGSEAQSMAEAEGRRLRVSSLGSVSPNELSADQAAAYREDLKKLQEDQAKSARDALIEARKAAKALERIANKLDPTEPKEDEFVVVQIENNSDTVARFAAIASGDSLTSDR